MLGDQGRHEDDDVAQRTREHPELAGPLAHALARALAPVERLLAVAVGHELDADHQAALTDVADVRKLRDGPQPALEQPARLLHATDEAVPLEEVEARERHSAAQLIAGERVTVE